MSLSWPLGLPLSLSSRSSLAPSLPPSLSRPPHHPHQFSSLMRALRWVMALPGFRCLGHAVCVWTGGGWGVRARDVFDATHIRWLARTHHTRAHTHPSLIQSRNMVLTKSLQYSPRTAPVGTLATSVRCTSSWPSCRRPLVGGLACAGRLVVVVVVVVVVFVVVAAGPTVGTRGTSFRPTC